MIRRKDSLGFVEFVRGKYPLTNREYILNILNEMTVEERDRVKTKTFDELWDSLWGGTAGSNIVGRKRRVATSMIALKMG